jgi:glycosyl-4,4'-diaponeurosporenoate acyltransferase
VSLPIGIVVAVDITVWCAVQVGSGYAVHRLPDEWLQHDRWLFRERRAERGGELYRRALRVPRWKRLLPEAGAVFAGGFDKRALGGSGGVPLTRHLWEGRRAELGHWLAIAPLPLFVLWNPLALWPAMAVYAAAVNLPCIAVIRYNRLRLARVMAARASGSRRSRSDRSRSARGTIGSSIP